MLSSPVREVRDTMGHFGPPSSPVAAKQPSTSAPSSGSGTRPGLTPSPQARRADAALSPAPLHRASTFLGRADRSMERWCTRCVNAGCVGHTSVHSERGPRAWGSGANARCVEQQQQTRDRASLLVPSLLRRRCGRSCEHDQHMCSRVGSARQKPRNTTKHTETGETPYTQAQCLTLGRPGGSMGTVAGPQNARAWLDRDGDERDRMRHAPCSR